MQMLQRKRQNADLKTYVLAIPSVLGGVLAGLLLCLMNYGHNVCGRIKKSYLKCKSG